MSNIKNIYLTWLVKNGLYILKTLNNSIYVCMYKYSVEFMATYTYVYAYAILTIYIQNSYGCIQRHFKRDHKHETY